MGDINFCQHCGDRLGEKVVEERVRPWCPSCGYIVFLDPKVATIVLVLVDGKLVLVRRGIEPSIGRWSFPSGYVNRGEMVEDAAVREVIEETGLEVRLDGLVGLYSGSDEPVILAVYTAHVTGGSLYAGPEVQETALFSPAELPSLPFPHDYQILEDWRSMKRGASEV